jgi:hypothetical protein
MRSQWATLQPTYSGAAYASVPSIAAPYAEGDLVPAFRADGLKMLNFARYLAGLPADVNTDTDLNHKAQHGATLLKVIGFSHNPSPKPADMDQSFYDVGVSGTASSNIGSGYSDLETFQRGCLDDADTNNITALGHRRWLLNPRMLKTGLGYVEARTVTYAFDTSRPLADVSYDYIAWPSAGIFPVEFVNARTPWSITLNPDRYDWDAAGFTVTMKRVSDGRTWTFDASDTNTAGEYFGFNTGGYGVRNVFIFRPTPEQVTYAAGDQFDIELRGGIYAQGTRTPVTVQYRTSFGALSGPSTSFASEVGTTPPANPPSTPPSTPPAGSSFMPVYRFYNTGNGSHFYTASAEERDAVRAKWSAVYAYEGPAYLVNTANPANCTPLYRFYNTSSGSHFYTASAEERDTVRARWSAVYTYEGAVYNVSLTAANSSPMYRFYNKRNGSHFYTVSAEERDRVIATLGATYGYEGVCYYIGN